MIDRIKRIPENEIEPIKDRIIKLLKENNGKGIYAKRNVPKFSDEEIEEITKNAIYDVYFGSPYMDSGDGEESVLMPCPHCGGKANMVYHCFRELQSVECERCYCQTPFLTLIRNTRYCSDFVGQMLIKEQLENCYEISRAILAAVWNRRKPN